MVLEGDTSMEEWKNIHMLPGFCMKGCLFTAYKIYLWQIYWISFFEEFFNHDTQW